MAVVERKRSGSTRFFSGATAETTAAFGAFDATGAPVLVLSGSAALPLVVSVPDFPILIVCTDGGDL